MGDLGPPVNWAMTKAEYEKQVKEKGRPLSWAPQHMRGQFRQAESSTVEKLT